MTTMEIKKKKTPKMEGKLVLVTPEMAHEFLSRNTRNRNLDERTVTKYARDMIEGRWRVTGEPISFDWNNVMLNGQHRCHAIIRANKAVYMFVVTGLDPASQDNMDDGKHRTLADKLRLRGEKNCVTLAGSITILWNYDQYGRLSNKSGLKAPSDGELLEYYEKHPELRDYMNVPFSKMNSKLLSPTHSATLYYLFSVHSSEQDAREFLELLATGKGLSETDPIYHLRERLIREMNKPFGRILPSVRSALAIKAFNQWMQGQQVRGLKWNGGGSKPEPYPRVMDFRTLEEEE